MFKKILIGVLFLFIFLLPTTSFASTLETPGIEKVYSNFLIKLERKLPLTTKRISFLKLLNEKIDYILLHKNLNAAQIWLLNDLTKLSNEEIFSLIFYIEVNKYSFELSEYELSKIFKYKASNNESIFLENWVWYYYKYNNHLTFPKWTNITEKDLTFNKIDKDSDLIFLKEDNSLWFAVEYEKIKLIKDDIIFWITDKYNFLKELKDDKKYLTEDTDDIFLSLKEDSINLTKWKASKEKVSILYNYVLDNISYPLQIDLSNKTIFSWISAYKLKSAACEWYTKLFNYMLKFSWVSDVEVIRGFVIDAQDFPQIWHAWIKIWDYYYDPTFDDPVWAKKTLEYNQYKYFHLPEDIFYTNRYLYTTLPESLKTTSMDYRKNLIAKNLSELVDKYSKRGYNLLTPFIFREDNWFTYNEDITLSNFDKITPMYTVDNFQYNYNWYQKTIKKLSFYTLTNDNIEVVLEQLNYNLIWHYFYKWKMQDWSYEYRLWYNVTFN